MPKKTKTKAVAKHTTWRDSPIAGRDAGLLFENDDERKAYNAKVLSEAMEYFNVPRVKTDEEFIDRAEAYFTRCAMNGIKPTWEEMALAMGTTRATLWDWETGRYGNISPDIVKQVKEIFSTFDAKLVADGKLNPVTYIFRSKNYYGMKDQTEHVLTPNAGDNVDEKTLIEQAEMLPDVE